MLDLVRRLICERRDAYVKERDELLKIIKLPLIHKPGEEPNYSPEIRRLIIYADAYTDILNRLNAEPTEMHEGMTDSEKRLVILNAFLSEVKFDWSPETIDRADPDFSQEVLDGLKARFSIHPETFPAALWIWYMEKYHPATPKFDNPTPPEEPSDSNDGPEAA